MEKKNVVLLTVIAVATLLITVVGATFAYFAATITGNDQAEEIKVTSAKGLTITYNGGETISGSNILPGWGETYATSGVNEYEVTVSNDNQFDVTYTMKWSAVSNGLNADDQKNLTYDAKGVVAWSAPDSHGGQDNTASALDVTAQKFPTEDDGVFTTQTLQAGEKITYTIKLAYKYDEENEQESKGATFTAKLNIASDDIQVKTHVAA